MLLLERFELITNKLYSGVALARGKELLRRFGQLFEMTRMEDWAGVGNCVAPLGGEERKGVSQGEGEAREKSFDVLMDGSRFDMVFEDKVEECEVI